MIPPGLKTQVNSEMDLVATQLAVRQANYLAARGRYFQCLPSPPTTPADGVAVAHDASRRPSDQAEDWDGVGVTLPPTGKVSISIHAYDGPLGHGYSIVGRVKVGTKTYIKKVSTGPEPNRDHDWAEIKM